MPASLNIVVVEDHDHLREMTCAALTDRGHRVVGLSCAEELEDEAKGDPVDAFVLDLNLPGEDGISLARRIRNAYPLVGIIMLTARSHSSDKIAGYESGADLYLTKPVDLDELCAAIKSFARRRSIAEPGLESLTISLSNRELTGPKATVRLTQSEAAMLRAFSRAPAGTLEVWQLAEILRLDLDRLNKASLEVRIVRLRKKFIDAGVTGTTIDSIRNVGYQLFIALQIS
jgi:DNA-binding response OmpR family regulator